MTHTRALLLLTLLGCHATAPTSSEHAVSEPAVSEPAAPVPRQPRATRQASQPPSEPAPLPLQVERDDPSGSPCEWSCADVHDCALLSGDYRPSAAASIEIGCVDMCLRTPERATLFGCQRPPSLEPGPCSPFLDCVAAAWPDGHTPMPMPTAAPSEDGCMLGCRGFALCWDPSTTPEQIERCAEMCRRALDERDMQVFADCARLPDCDTVKSCVSTLPGARGP